MAPPRAPRARQRPRPETLDRPINARTYRGTWLLAGIPLLILAFSVSSLPTLPRPPGYIPSFDTASAAETAQSLAQSFPDRRPGTSGASGAADFVQQAFEREGYRVARDPFNATIAGLGSRHLVNLVAEAPGRSQDTILLVAHRDDTGGGGLVDNASGTAALLELARAYGPRAGTAQAPLHTIVFLSSDGGAYGGIGAARYAKQILDKRTVIAAIDLDAIAAAKPVRVVLASDTASSPDPTLVGTVRQALADTAPRLEVTHASTLHQLLDLAFPFTLYEQGAFTARGTPGIGLTTALDRPPDTPTGGPVLDPARLRTVGLATGRLIASIDTAGTTSTSTRTYVLAGGRRIPGWTIQLLLLAALLPALVAIVDLFARCRRRAIPLRPALRALGARCGYWLCVLLVFELLNLLGLFPYGTNRPVSLETSAAQDWPVPTLILLGLIAAAGWLVLRQRLLPRREPSLEEEVAGHTAALLGLAVLSLLVVALNRYSLLLLLPSLHAWIWLPQLRVKPRWMRIGVFVVGLGGPLWLVHSFATRLGLGFDAPWYLLELAVVHVITFPFLVVACGWLAVAAQLLTLTTGRYAPWPKANELPPGALSGQVRRLAVAGRARASAPRRRASGA
jgi:hypothetical protein